MLQSEVINKLSRECCLAMGSFDYFKTVRIYIQMALAVGVEHYAKEMEEIVVLDMNGTECGRYKSIVETAEKLGLFAENISAALNGRQQTSGGFKYIKTRDYELIKREEHSTLNIIPLK